jgi:hypothetical protein
VGVFVGLAVITTGLTDGGVVGPVVGWTVVGMFVGLDQTFSPCFLSGIVSSPNCFLMINIVIVHSSLRASLAPVIPSFT